jgi:TP901 family phage tail tape measure protein
MADIQSNINLNIDTTEALASIRALQSQISAFHRTLAKGGASANAQSSQMQQNLINTINKTGAYSASMTKVASTTESFTNALEKNKLTMGQTFKYSMATTKTFGKFFKSEFDTISKTARERVKDLQTQYIRLGRDASGAMNAIQVRPLALDMKNYGTQTAIAAQKQQIFNKLITQGSTNLLNWGKNTQWAGRQLMVGFTIPLAMMGAAAAKSFMDIEKEIIKIRRVYGDFTTTVQETDKAIDSLKALANEFTKYGVAVKDTLELAGDFAAAGFEGAKLTAQVREASRLAVLGAVDQKEAFEATISVTNAFGVAAEDLAGKIDFLNAVENQSVLSIEDLTIAIPKAGPVVKQLGGSVEDLAFFLTAMKEGGVNASEGANALKSGLASLINPTKVSSEFLQKLGININAIVEGNAGDVKGTVIGFAQALDTLDPLNRARAIEQLFGKFQFSRISTLFQNVIDQGSQANRVLKLTNASSAELAVLSERELKRVESSPVFKFEKALQNFQTALAPVGEQFLKAVTPLIEFGTKLLQQFNGMSDGAKNFAVVAVAAIGGIGPILLMVIGLIANAAANIIKFVNFIRGRFQNTAGEVGILGSQTEYLTQAQIKAMSAAASLQQAHSTLTQQFTSEIGAIQNLITAYNQAILAQNRFAAAAAPAKALTITTNARGGRRVIAPQGYASGVLSVPGPKGAGDVVPAMLSPGEAVIPAKPAKKYAPFIQDMISGNIPGFMRGVFLGMPKSSKAVSKNREAGQQINELFKQSSFANTPATTYGHQIAPTTGHSFPIFGLGGVYQKGNKRVFVKPVMDEKAALAEMRATQIAREAHGLESPKQRIVVIKDPVDVTGQRKYLALESDLNPKFVNNSPLGVFNEKQYFKQLTASLLRADKDLSASNVYRNVVADVGPAGVFDRASGLRDYAKRLPSMEEQALVNLLGVKGGAKKAFAESTKGLISGLTPEKYHQRMISEIQETLPKLKNTIASFNLKDPRDIGVYADMVKRLESGLNVDWRKFHTIHSSVTIPKPKVPKNVDSSELLRQYQSGTASVAPLLPSERTLISADDKKIFTDLDLDSKSQGLYTKYLNWKAPKGKKYRDAPTSLGILNSNDSFYQGKEALAKMAKAGVNREVALRIISDAANKVTSQASAQKMLSNIDLAIQKSIMPNGKIDLDNFKLAARKSLGVDSHKILKEFAHVGPGAKLSAKELLKLSSEGKIKLSASQLRNLAAANPSDILDIKSGLGFDLKNTREDPVTKKIIRSNAELFGKGSRIKDFLVDYEKSGIEKWSRSIGFGGGDPAQLSKQVKVFDSKIVEILKSYPADTVVVDSQQQAKRLIAQNKNAVSFERVFGSAIEQTSSATKELQKSFKTASMTPTEIRNQNIQGFRSPGEARKLIGKPLEALSKQIGQSGNAPLAKIFGRGIPGSVSQLAMLLARSRGLPMSSRISGYASGVVSVPGPKGAGDVVPAMLSPGEAVIPTKMAKRYSPLINAMIGGNIPGYFDGKFAPPKLDTNPFGTSSEQIAGASPSQRKTFGNAIGTGFGKTREVTRALASSTTRVLKDVVVGNMDKNTGVLGKLGRSVAIGLGNLGRNRVADSTGKVLTGPDAGAAKSAAAAGSNSATRPPMIVGGVGSQKGSDDREDRKNRKSRLTERVNRAGGGLMGLSMAAGMASMMPGAVGETAQKVMLPLMGISAAMSMLPGPIGLVVSGLIAAGAVVFHFKEELDKARKAARESALATSSGSKAMEKFAEFAGTTTSTSVMNQMRRDQMSPFSIVTGKNTFGSQFIESEGGQALLNEALKSKSLEAQGVSAEKIGLQLSQAIASNILTKDQAFSIASSLGEAMGDYDYVVDVNARMIELLGPGGEDLLNDPLAVKVLLVEEKGKELGVKGGAKEIISFNTSTGKTLEESDPVVPGGMRFNRKEVAGAEAQYSQGFQDIIEMGNENVNALEKEHLQRLEILKASGDQAGVAEEERKYLEDRQKLLKENADAIKVETDYLNELEKKGGVFAESAKAILLNVRQDLMDSMVGMDQAIIDANLKTVNNIVDNPNLSFADKTLLTAMIDVENIDLFKQLQTTFPVKENIEFWSKVAQIGIELGPGTSMQMMNLLSKFDDETKADQFLNYTFKLQTEGDIKQAQAAIDTMEMLTKIPDMGIEIDLGEYVNDEGVTDKFLNIQSRIQKVNQLFDNSDGKQLEYGINFESMGFTLTAEQAAWFNELPLYSQKVFALTYTTMEDTITPEQIAAKRSELRAEHRSRGGRKFSVSDEKIKDMIRFERAEQLAEDSTPIGTNDLLDGMDEEADGGSGAQTLTFLDEIVRKLRNVRDQTLKLPNNFEEAVAAINRFGSQGAAGFSGLAQAIRNAGGGTEFLNIALSATEEELAKIFENGQLTELGRNLQTSLSRLSIGNFIEEQKASTKASKDQVKALKILTDAGVSLANAQEMVQDESFAEGLATGTANDAQKAINEWMKAQENGRKLLSEAERTIEAEGLNIRVFSARIGEFQAGLNVIQLQEDDINKIYDERLEALDKVQEANDNIVRQQQSQLSLADALSKGDIAAAARAMQQTKEQSAQNALQQQRTAIEKAREKELKSLQANVNGTLLNREEIQKKISNLQKQIADIELNKVATAQRIIAKQDRAAYLQISDQFRVQKPAGGGGGGGSTATPAPAADRGQYTVVPGDTLWGIAQRYYGKGSDWPKIYDRNKAVIGSNPNLIYPGQVYTIPFAMGGMVPTQKYAMGGMIKLPVPEPAPAQMAGGGKVGYYPMGGMIPYKAMGGMFKTVNTDSIPAMLTPGEFVIRRSAVERFGQKNLEKINNGMADSMSSVYNYSVNVSVKSEANPDQIAQSVMRQIKQIDSQRIRGNRF